MAYNIFINPLSFLPVSFAGSGYPVVGAILLKIIESRQISPQENRGPQGLAVPVSRTRITEYSGLHGMDNLNYDKKRVEQHGVTRMFAKVLVPTDFSDYAKKNHGMRHPDPRD